MIQIEKSMTLTMNWIAEQKGEQQRTKSNYFNQLCKDSISGLAKKETIYAFSYDQVLVIQANAPFEIKYEENDGIFIVRRK